MEKDLGVAPQTGGLNIVRLVIRISLATNYMGNNTVYRSTTKLKLFNTVNGQLPFSETLLFRVVRKR